MDATVWLRRRAAERPAQRFSGKGRRSVGSPGGQRSQAGEQHLKLRERSLGRDRRREVPDGRRGRLDGGRWRDQGGRPEADRYRLARGCDLSLRHGDLSRSPCSAGARLHELLQQDLRDLQLCEVARGDARDGGPCLFGQLVHGQNTRFGAHEGPADQQR